MLSMRTRAHMWKVQFFRRGFAAAPAPKGNLREDEVEVELFRMFESGHENPFPPPLSGLDLTASGSGIEKGMAKDLMSAMMTTRIAHNVSRRAALTGQVFYTIGPGGHEAIAGLAAALRPTDPAILHYRDTAFQVLRAKQAGDSESMLKLMRTYTVSSLDSCTGEPVSPNRLLLNLRSFYYYSRAICLHWRVFNVFFALSSLPFSFPLRRVFGGLFVGRHKALGDKLLNIIPSTSTISSQFPRAAGLASSIPLAKFLKVPSVYPVDSVVVGCGGDASINHSTFVTAVNFLKYSHQGMKLKIPSLFVISDNGIGISVPTPQGWVENALVSTGLGYFRADGTNIYDVYTKATQAATSARGGTPTFFHMECGRLFNHAGSDAGSYQSPDDVARHLRADPLPASMHLWVRDGLATKEELKQMYSSIVADAEATLAKVVKEPKLSSLEEVMASLIPKPRGVYPVPIATPQEADNKPLIYKQQINRALDEALSEDPTVVLLGEDIGKKGGNYGVTDHLQKKHGAGRVRDTLLDETTILGLGCGLSLNGMLPIVEICYLAYIHNAIDQLRGEAATLSFFSNGQYKNGFMIRISGGGLTEFGGHYHNENSLACFYDIPGLIVVYPSNGADYVRYFRKCLDLCRDGRVVVLIEPIKAYALRQFGKKNTNWTFPFPSRDEVLELGAIQRYGDGQDLAIATYGNGVVLALEAQRILKEEHGINSTILEQSTLRGGDPLAFPRALSEFSNVLFADECRYSGAISHENVSILATKFPKARHVAVVAAADTLIPTGPAAHVPGLYLSESRIVQAALELLKRPKGN